MNTMNLYRWCYFICVSAHNIDVNIDDKLANVQCFPLYSILYWLLGRLKSIIFESVSKSKAVNRKSL